MIQIKKNRVLLAAIAVFVTIVFCISTVRAEEIAEDPVKIDTEVFEDEEE